MTAPITTFTITNAVDLANDIIAIGTSISGSGGSYGIDAGTGLHYTFFLKNNVSLTQASGPIWLSQGDTLTIQGQGHTLDGGGLYRGLFVYDNNPDTHVEIDNLTIANAVAQGGSSEVGGGGAGLGGGLFVNQGAVTLSNVVFSRDAARGGNSGASGTGSGQGGGGFGGSSNSAGGGGYGATSDGLSGADGFGFAQQGGGDGGAFGGGNGGIGGGGGNGYHSGGSGGDFGGGGNTGQSGVAGQGGFGGGGGSGGQLNTGGFGGFGGGGGAFGKGGFGGGDGDSGKASGGGGLGAGGAVFVRAGASLVFASGGDSGGVVSFGTAANNGRALGSGIFLNGTTGLTLAPGAGQTLLIADDIADQSGNGGTGANAGAGSVTIGGTGLVTLSGSNSYVGGTTINSNAQLLLTNSNAAGSGAIMVSGDPGTLRLAPGVSLTNTVNATGGVIDLQGLAPSVTPNVIRSGGMTTITVGGPAGNQVILGGTLPFTQSADGTGGSLLTVACFLAGTRLRTTEGETPVEDLAVGTHLSTRGGSRPIVWIGQRAIDVTRHPFPTRVWPIRIRAGAFAQDVPSRDLYLSPEHAVLCGDVLVPVHKLVNSTSVLRVPMDHVRYFHVELDAHDIVFAEGLETESWLDTGNRSMFANAPVADLVARLDHIEVGAGVIWTEHGCAPLCTDGAPLAAIRARLAARATARRDAARQNRALVPVS